MRRDTLSARLGHVEWLDTGGKPTQPALIITFDGSPADLKDRFRSPGSKAYTPADVDVFHRPKPSARAVETGGVLGIGDSLTGHYLLEVDLSPSVIEQLVYAVCQYAGAVETGTRYTIELWAGEQQVGTFDKETLLAYDEDGALLRHRSLIPDSIEM